MAMKNLLPLMILASLLGSAPAWAAPGESNFNRFFSVDADGSQTKKNSFSETETPWAFGQFDGVGANRYANFQTDWYFNSSLLGEADRTGGNGEHSLWATPSNWSSIKKEGKWTILGFFQVRNSSDDSIFKTGSNSHSFTVTPEPASFALFAFGAGALGFMRRRSSKK
jgi:hypothetical protein